MRRFLLSLFLAGTFTLPLSAFYLDLSLGAGWSDQVRINNYNYEFFQISAGESFFNEIFHVETSLQVWVDNRFAGTDGVTAFYFKPNYGGARITWEGLNVALGYYQPHDRVDSPYALFLNSAYLIDPLANSHAKPAINIGYENDYVFFDYNWTMLQYNEVGRDFYTDPINPVTGQPWDPKSDSGQWVVKSKMMTGDPKLQRGYNYKTFGGKVGGFSFAYQDAMLYSGRLFDWAYYLIPLPSVLVQYTRNAAANPGAEEVNDQSLMGIFMSYITEDKNMYAYGQFLMDDVSLYTVRFGQAWNPFKVAWSLGGWYQSEWGRFGFFHAGATKHLFQGVEGEGSKSYTYNTFNFFESGRFLEAQDTWIGYKNGGNNISFMLAYQNKFMEDKLRYKGAVEISITGSQSPNGNPWGDAGFKYWDNDGAGTRILSGPIETKVLFYNSVGYQLLDWLDLVVDSKTGFAHNAMTLVFPKATEQVNLYPYLSPGKQTKWLFDLRLGVRFYFDWKFGLKEGEVKPKVLSYPTSNGEPPKFEPSKPDPKKIKKGVTLEEN